MEKELNLAQLILCVQPSGYKSKSVNLQMWSQFLRTGPWPNEILEISEDKDALLKGASSVCWRMWSSQGCCCSCVASWGKSRRGSFFFLFLVILVSSLSVSVQPWLDSLLLLWEALNYMKLCGCGTCSNLLKWTLCFSVCLQFEARQPRKGSESSIYCLWM